MAARLHKHVQSEVSGRVTMQMQQIGMVFHAHFRDRRREFLSSHQLQHFLHVPTVTHVAIPCTPRAPKHTQNRPLVEQGLRIRHAATTTCAAGAFIRVNWRIFECDIAGPVSDKLRSKCKRRLCQQCTWQDSADKNEKKKTARLGTIVNVSIMVVNCWPTRLN
jgi:hypothetical protein